MTGRRARSGVACHLRPEAEEDGVHSGKGGHTRTSIFPWPLTVASLGEMAGEPFCAGVGFWWSEKERDGVSECGLVAIPLFNIYRLHAGL